MQGAGNDFVLVEGRDGREADWPALARAICERHFGIGADGLLVVRPSQVADVRMLMWNPDGSESEMCGNGIRCFARYVLDQPSPTAAGALSPSPAAAGEGRVRAALFPRPPQRERARERVLTVETGAGILDVRRHPLGMQASLGRPILAGPRIPVLCDRDPVLDLPLPGLDALVTCVSTGNPHAVQFVQDVAAVDLAALGPRVERHPLFPHRTNFHVCQVVSRGELLMRSWERGAGLTQACGTGAAATMVAARLRSDVDDIVKVRVPGGELEVTWDGQGDVVLAGPAEYVFEGDWLRPSPARAGSGER